MEALAVKLTQKEGELIQEKFEVKKLANFLKQVIHGFFMLHRDTDCLVSSLSFDVCVCVLIILPSSSKPTKIIVTLILFGLLRA